MPRGCGVAARLGWPTCWSAPCSGWSSRWPLRIAGHSRGWCGRHWRSHLPRPAVSCLATGSAMAGDRRAGSHSHWPGRRVRRADPHHRCRHPGARRGAGCQPNTDPAMARERDLSGLMLTLFAGLAAVPVGAGLAAIREQAQAQHGSPGEQTSPRVPKIAVGWSRPSALIVVSSPASNPGSSSSRRSWPAPRPCSYLARTPAAQHGRVCSLA
jgi:hypothetical protein